MQETHLPVTAFLIKDAVQEHLMYWKDFVSAGGVIEDHTISHPPLTSLNPSGMYAQWHTPIVDYKAWFGTSPTLGRPPYGAVDAQVVKEAQAAGLQHVVMWSAVVGKKGLTTWNGGPLAAGDIVLLHWDPGLYPELIKVLALARADGLTPTSLPAALSSD